MEARKLLYTAMAIAPAVLMAGIGIHARTYVDPFDWPGTQEDHVRTKAYIPLVLETRDKLSIRDSLEDTRIRQIAKKWVDGWRKGELKPLVPVTLDDLSSPGHKAKIVNVNNFLARKLIVIADSEIKFGNYQQAAEDLFLAADSMTCLKYSNFLSLYRVSLAFGSILRRIELIYARLDAHTQVEVASSMQRMVCEDKQLAQMKRLTKRMIQDEARIYQETHSPDAFTGQSELTGNFFEQPASAKGNEDNAENFDFVLPNLTLEAQQCIAVDRRNRLMIQRIMSLSDRSAT